VQKHIVNGFFPNLAERLTFHESTNREMYVEALSSAHHAYGVKSAYILLVREPNEMNIYDQGYILDGLQKKGITHQILTYPQTDALKELLSMDKETGKLYYCGEATPGHRQEISVVYWRYNSNPKLYFKEESDWAFREMIEMSQAIKCPTVEQ
jgi:hypothetical protein